MLSLLFLLLLLFVKFSVVVEIEIGMFVFVDSHEEIVDGDEEIVVVFAYGNRVIEKDSC